MVKPVDRIVPDFAAAGASIITFHPEASEHVDRTLQLIKENGCKAGLVFNPATPLSYLDYVMDKLDVILLMSVNPGFGGQSFIPQTLDKLRESTSSYRRVWLRHSTGSGRWREGEQHWRNRCGGRGYVRRRFGNLRPARLQKSH